MQRLFVVFFCLLDVTLRAALVLPNIKMDVLSAVQSNAATLTAAAFDLGNINQVFDGKSNTLARTPNINPAFVQVAYQQPRTVSRFRVFLSYGTRYDWWIEKADTQADMEAHAGTYALITPTNSLPSGLWDESVLPAPVTARLFRLNVRRYGGDGYCHINEWELYADVTIDELRISPPTASLFVGDVLQFHAIGRSSALNESYNLDALVEWQMTGGIGTITTNGLFTARGSGVGTVGARAGDLASPAATITVAQALPDIDVLYIERTPRLAFDSGNTNYTTGLPTNGQPVVYLAHVKNWGTNAVRLPFEWWFDDSPSRAGVTNMEPGERLAIPFPWSWETNDHTIEFHADPEGTLVEASTLNNRVRIRSNALLVGLWVEQSLYNYFHQTQLRLNDGANSFEDWGQRMVKRWNDLMAKSIFPTSPEGFLDRLALDQVRVVPDDALPLAGGLSGNNPDSRDRTVDMQWGYPWNPTSTNAGAFYGFRWSGPFYIDFGSIHEMNHARYHVDLYALDANHNANEPNIQLIDDNTGQLVVGSSKMPFIAWDVAYYNKWRDIMGAGPNVFDAYTAAAWNWKHHRRGQGNQNSPPDLGRFMGDLPLTNHVQFIDQNGLPLAGANVSVYQGTGFYSESFDNVPEQTLVTDTNGMIHLGRNPFGSIAGYSSGPVLIFKVRYQGESYFLFQEVTDFNLENWFHAGPRRQATNGDYIREIDLRNKPVSIPNNGWLGNYFNGEKFDSFVSSRTDPGTNGLDFIWPGGLPAGVDTEHFSVYWQGGIPFTSGWKQFDITSDGGFRLYINHRLVFDQWTNTTLRSWTPVLYTMSSSPFVNPGRSASYGTYHRVEVRYRHATGPGRVHLRWADEAPPAYVPLNSWRADYYTTKNLAGYMLSREEVAIDNEYANGSPDPAIGSDNFSARWTGQWDFPGGTVEFKAITEDGMRVWIDGASILDQWKDQALTTNRFTRNLTAGLHRIQVEYFNGGGPARAAFTWSMPLRIDKNLSNQTAFAGSTVTLGIAAAGIPAPTFQWQLNGTNIPGATAATFTITNIQNAQAGEYTVQVFNGTASIISKPAVLTVVPRPPSLMLSASHMTGSGSFAFDMVGLLSSNQHRVQATTNFSQWQVLTNLVTSNSPATFTDPTAPQHPSRFYRIEILPPP